MRPSIRRRAPPGSRRPCSGSWSSSLMKPWRVWRTTRRSAPPPIRRPAVSGSRRRASSIPRAGGVDLADRDYFKQAVATRRFVISGFVVGRTTGMNIMVLAEPVLDDKGAVTSVVFLSLDLGWIGRQMQQMAVPPGSNVALVDGAGTVMALYPYQPDTVGRKIPELARFTKQHSTGHVDGVHIVGNDQVSRVYVSAALPGTPGGSAFIRAGIPTGETIAEATHALRRNLLALAAAAQLGRRQPRIVARGRKRELSGRNVPRCDGRGRLPPGLGGVCGARRTRNRCAQAEG